MSEITLLLEAANRGDPAAWDQLLPMVYSELRRLASLRLADEASNQTLQPTALVHEAYLRLLGSSPDEMPIFLNQRHFFAAAATSMRRILIDRARARKAEKRGGDRKREALDLNQISLLDTERAEEVLLLDEALTELSGHDAKVAELISLRFFGGLTHQQAAEVLDLTRREADRLWALGRSWLFRRLANP